MTADEIKKKITDLESGIRDLEQKALINRGAILAYQDMLQAMEEPDLEPVQETE